MPPILPLPGAAEDERDARRVLPLRRGALHGCGRAGAAWCLPLFAVPQAIGSFLGRDRGPALRAHDRGRREFVRFRSSEKVRRGFCSTCGSVLLWDPIEKDRISVAMGAFEAPTGTRLRRHIFVADKGDYYQIEDGLPQFEKSTPGILVAGD